MTRRLRERGMVLLAALVVVTIGALIGSTIMYLADAERASAEASLRRTQARALAWSGVQGVMAELLSQREALLDGARPAVTGSWTLIDGTSKGGVIRVVGLSGAGAAVSEPGKLDINSATAEMLDTLDAIEAPTAARIVAARAARAFSSVEELLTIEGVTPEMMYGPSAQGAESGEGLGAAALAAAPGRPSSDAREGGGLVDLLTVFSFDPNVQAGLGENGSDSRGKRRVNINTPWSERLGRAIDERFGQGAGEAVKTVMERGTKLEREAEIVRVLIETQVPPEAWVNVLDALTTTDDPYRTGRVDLNTAPAEVLACIPGISRSAAEGIVESRGRTDEATRRSVAWPVLAGILEPEQFQEAVDFLTTRSAQWRVRVEAGFVRVETGRGGEPSQGSFGGSEPGAWGESDESGDTLEDRVALEAVIDVSSSRPRVAYLRDVTLLPIARQMYARGASGGAEGGTADDREASESSGESGAEAAEPGESGSDESPGTFGTFDLGGNSGGDDSDEGAAPESPAGEEAGSGETLLDGESERDRSGAGSDASETGERPAGRDRRIGRWASGRARSGGGG